MQRCAEDLSILITTYEGKHNHPLQVSATAMAFTTSAAASMLVTGSSTSQPHTTQASPSFANPPTLFNGLNFSQQFEDQSRSKQQQQQQIFIPPHHHASHNLFPTVTLDLTSQSTSSTHLHNIPSNQRFSPNNNLSFCSPPQPNFTPSSIWGKGFPNNNTLPIEKTHIRPITQGNHNHFNHHQQCMINKTSSREALAETITRAISKDPSLHSVIAAAVSSIVGQGSKNDEERENNNILGAGLNLKLGEHSNQMVSTNLLNRSYFKRLSSTTSSQTRNFMLLQPSLPFSINKSNTSKAPSNVNQINHYDLDRHTHH